MARRVVFARVKADDIRLTKRGAWRPVRRDGLLTANVSCPNCGLVASLSDHEIVESGDVDPSLVCPGDQCDFHSFVTLSDWGSFSGWTAGD